MKEAQETKKTIVIAPAVVDGAAFTIAAPVDTKGAGYLEMLFICGAMADVVGASGTSNVPILEECETDSVTAGDWTEIADAKLAAVIPATATKMYQIDVDLMNSTRKRYIRPKAPTSGATGAGAAMCVIGILYGLQVGPVTAAQRGLAEHVIA